MAQTSLANVNFDNIINNNHYKFNVGLFTADGRYQELKIGAINSLVLEDTFTNFYHKGYIIINNRFDGVERLADFKNNEKIGTTSTFTPDKGFIFKGDSRDMLLIDIMPKLDESPYGVTDSKDAEDVFRLIFTFSIYDSEEIPGTLPGEKFKKLSFWDIHYEFLKEKNSYFTTSNYINNSGVTNLSDNDRSIPTGDAVKFFLKEFFTEEDGWSASVSDEEFDKGSTSVFFSAPARYKGIDCLQYLMSRHVSDKNDNYDQGFLRLERGSNVFKLQSLNKIFKKALNGNTSGVGEYYLETFKLGIYSDKQNDFGINAVSYTPLNGLYLGKFGTINNFSYDAMPGIYSQQEIVSTIVHSYDYESKTFNIDEERNTMSSCLSVYSDNYVKPFNSLSIDNNAYINFYPGEYRFLQKNVKNIFSVIETPDQRLSFGRNKVLFGNIFLNNTVLFKVPGSTHREAGKFIGIDRDGAIPYSDFDSKLLGVYFVVEVKHIFEGNEYFNELRCVKTYSYDNLFLINSR